MRLAPLRKVPVVGEFAYRVYMRARYDDGRAATIREGPLKGMKFRRWLGTSLSGYTEGVYEAPVTNTIVRLCKPGMTFYDVGANAGYMSLVGSICVGKAGKVIAFEPVPRTVRELTSQLRVNRVRNVRVVRAAVCDRNDPVSLCLNGGANMASLIRHWSGHELQVRGITIDAAAARYGPPDVIKIDIEEAELLALQGARETIARRRPVIMMELHSAKLAKECLALLDAAGYVHAAIEGGDVDREKWTRFVVSTPNDAMVPSINIAVGKKPTTAESR